MNPAGHVRRMPPRAYPGAPRAARPAAIPVVAMRQGSRSLIMAMLPLVMISLLGIATISSGSALWYDLPRLFLLSLGFTVVLFLLCRLRISYQAVAFVVAYIGGLSIGTVAAFADRRLEWPSSIQLLASLATFVVVATYVEDWLQRSSNTAKLRALELILLFFLLFAVADIAFYKTFGQVRQYLYDYNILMSIDRTYNRDMSLYFLPRPVCFFSEASNFARFIGILIAYHVHVSNFSKRSIGWLALFELVTRSTSMLFPAPVLAIVLYRSISAAPGARAGLRKNRVPIMIGVALVILVVVGASQIGRLSSDKGSSSGGDASVASRLGTPVEYMVNVWENRLIGSGATPQDQVQEYVLATEIAKGRDYLATVQGYREGIATSIICVIAMGLAGLAVFTGTAMALLGRVGLLVVGSFFFANFLSAGYNSAAMFVPWALIYPLLLAPPSLGTGRPRRPRSPAFALGPRRPMALVR